MTNEELEIAKVFATEAYKDIASPIAKQIGSTLQEVAKLVLSPVYYPTKMLNKRIENWFERISNELDKEELAEAAPNISIPTMQALALNQDDTLIGEMFYNILKSSVDKQKQKFNSPAFPKILEQLTRDECMFLVILNSKSYKIHQEQDLDEQKNVFCNNREILNELPVEKFDFPDNYWLYSDHLSHLNLAGCWQYKNQEPILDENNRQIGITIFSEFKLTEFGKQFCKICISEKCNEFV